MSSGSPGGLPDMLIVAGHLVVDPAERDGYVADCRAVVEAGRAAPGCLDFAVAADPVDPARILVYERWTGEEPLLAFRGSGPSGDQQAQILDADVRRYEISAEGPA
jgi:quinol monooxygenase YgiN